MTTVDEPAGFYFDEFEERQVFRHKVRRTVTDADNMLFTVMTMNTQPLHLDAEFAKNSVAGEIMCNSIFTLGLSIGVGVQEITGGTTIGNLGFKDINFPRPVVIGDTIRGETEVKELRASKSRPDAGIVTFEHRGYNQRDEVVCVATRMALMMKKPV